MRTIWMLLAALAACNNGGADTTDTDDTTDTNDTDFQADGCTAVCQSHLYVTYHNADYDHDDDWELDIEGGEITKGENVVAVYASCPKGELLRNPPGMELTCTETELDSGDKPEDRVWSFELEVDDFLFPSEITFSDRLGVMVATPKYTQRKVCETTCNEATIEITHPFGN